MNAYYLSQSSPLSSFHMSMPEPPSSMPSASRSSLSSYPYPYGDHQSTYHNHNRDDLALQTYLALHSQHESLVQHLDELRPCASLRSPSTSPTRSQGRMSSPLPRQRQRSSGFGFGPTASVASVATASTFGSSSSSLTSSLVGCSGVGDDQTLATHAAEVVALEEAKLCDVNEGIKRTLTELLNCEATRGEGNRQFRSWVQGRLMEAERELRRGRRRRTSAGSAYSE